MGDLTNAIVPTDMHGPTATRASLVPTLTSAMMLTSVPVNPTLLVQTVLEISPVSVTLDSTKLTDFARTSTSARLTPVPPAPTTLIAKITTEAGGATATPDTGIPMMETHALKSMNVMRTPISALANLTLNAVTSLELLVVTTDMSAFALKTTVSTARTASLIMTVKTNLILVVTMSTVLTTLLAPELPAIVMPDSPTLALTALALTLTSARTDLTNATPTLSAPMRLEEHLDTAASAPTSILETDLTATCAHPGNAGTGMPRPTSACPRIPAPRSPVAPIPWMSDLPMLCLASRPEMRSPGSATPCPSITPLWAHGLSAPPLAITVCSTPTTTTPRLSSSTRYFLLLVVSVIAS